MAHSDLIPIPLDLRNDLSSVAAEAAACRDPAELEAHVRYLPLQALLLAPPGLIEALVEALAGVAGGRSFLAALAAAAPPPLSARAAEAEARAQAAGEPLGPAAARVGTLVPVEAWLLDANEDVSSITLACRRPGLSEMQLLGATLERAPGGAVVKDGLVTRPVPAKQARELLLAPLDGSGIEPQSLSPPEAAARIAEAARRNVVLRAGPTADGLQALVLLLRAAGGAGAEELLAALALLPAREPVDYDALGEDAFAGDDDSSLDDDDEPAPGERERLVDGLVGEFAQWYEPQADERVSVDHAAFLALGMCDFRLDYADGRLAAWNAPDLREFLLDFAPRKISFDEKTIASTPEAVALVLRFLGESGRLDRSAAERLSVLSLALAPGFVEAAQDPRRWGVAKGFVMSMHGDGVDIEDEAAVAAWIADQNAQRRGAPVPSLLFAPPAPGGDPGPVTARRNGAEGKRRRKAQRKARRRNRH